jgi:N-acyl-D-aspartate/D-glutamate deacylase
MNEYDVLIENATIVEGTGKKSYTGSIGVIGDRVTTLGETKGDAKKVIEAGGLTAFPGFVDAHSHADMTFLWFPECESYVMQGVTTIVGGMCGGSFAPIGEYMRLPRRITRDHLFRLEPYKYYSGKPYYQVEQVNEWMQDIYGWTIDWRTMGGFFKKVEETGVSMNYAPLVGHGNIRIHVMGLDYKRHSTKKEMKEMRDLIEEAMDEGCIGMSTGLDYDPDVFASQEEIIDGVKILKKYDGVYHPHWRRTGRRRDVAAGHVTNEKITALMECVDVYKKTGVRLHLAHLSTGWDIYPKPPPELEDMNVKMTIDMITRESKGELDITWDAIPYFARGSRALGEAMPYLCAFLVPWLRELGSREELGKWLKVEDFREEVKNTIRSGKWFIRVAYNPNTNPKWAKNIYIVKSKIENIEGKSIAEIAKMRGTNDWDTWFDIISEDPDTRSVTSGIHSWNNLYYTHPSGMVGLDTDVCDDKYQFKEPPWSVRGINTYSAYPLIYTKLVRDSNVFSPEEFIKKTSTMPARVHNIKDRGVLKEGGYADIVIIDSPNMKVLSTELEPRKYPKGIEYVFVNGSAVVENGKHTGARPGRVLTRSV